MKKTVIIIICALVAAGVIAALIFCPSRKSCCSQCQEAEAAQIQETPEAQEEDPDIQYATTLLAPGTQAPDFTLKDISGKEVSLSDFAGKTVVLVFWASWCPDCRAEVPELKAMHAAADAGKVAFVSVSFDKEYDKFVSYVTENELPGVQLFDPAGKKDSTIGDAFGIKWIPALYVIGPDGKVVLGTVVASKVAAIL